MPTRSIALRMNLASPEHRGALWTTHRLINERTRWFVEHLLILRGDSVWTGDAALARTLGHPGVGTNHHGLFEISAAMVQTRLREHLARLAPGLGGAALDEAVQNLGKVYDLVVPSHAEDGEGDAQQANRFMGILLDPESSGGLSALEKSKTPEWVIQKQAGSVSWETAAEAWRLQTMASPRPTGRQPAWRGFAEEADPRWIEAYLADLGKNQKKAGDGGESALLAKLKQSGLLPVWNQYRPLKQELGDPGRGYLSKWDRLAFKLAVARLLSWESWNHRARKEHAARQAALASVEADLTAFASATAILKAYEQERTLELRRNNPLSQEAAEATTFRLGGRQIRKWEPLARELRKAGPGSDLGQIAADFQTRNPRECPDPYFTEWVLEAPERAVLWSTDEGVRAVQLLAKRNRLAFKAEQSRERTAMTPPHPRLHPVWLQFEEPSGSNLKSLDLEPLPGGGWAARMDLIHATESGLEEREVRIPLCASPQLALQRLEKLDKKKGGPGKTPVLTFIQAPSHARVDDRSAFETWRGTMQSPDILLDRGVLETKPTEPFDPAHLRADLKLVLDLEPQLVEGQGIAQEGANGFRWSEAPKWTFHLQTSLAESSKHEEALAEGKRFLAVDLGVRDLAAVALFELRRGTPEPGEKAFPIPSSTAWKAVLVPGSQATLSLPGEQEHLSESTQARRREVEDALRLLRFLKSRRTRLLALASPQASPKTRDKAREALLRQPKDPDAQARLQEEKDRHAKALALLLADDDPPRARRDKAAGLKQETRPANVDPRHHAVLRQAAALDPLPDLSTIPSAPQALRAWDEALSDLIRVWRDRTRRRDPRRSGLHGKSLWAIDHLAEVRDFLKGWHRRGSDSGEINRPGRDFAKTLLDHINQLKEDRTKEGANLLVNTARGLRYDATTHRWEQRFPPAHLILFEDLARYRFLMDRPRFENSQLMRWSHRELTKVTGQMAQMFGIGVQDTGAAFSSRYHGWSGAPGLRCKVFTESELRSPWFLRKWKESWQPVPGLPVPWEGGKRFITLDEAGKLVEEDADHNAAISLARRFSLRNGEAVRLVCAQRGDNFVPTALGKRLQGGLRSSADSKDKGFGHLVPLPGTEAFRWERLSQTEWERLSGKKAMKTESEEAVAEDDADAQEEALEAAEAESGTLDDAGRGKKVVFFRDPSGVFFDALQWVPGDLFWARVRQRLSRALCNLHNETRSF